MTDDEKILEKVISEFEALTHIPRPSGHERAVSDYLKKRFAEIGCSVVRDIWTWSASQSRVSPTIR